METVYQSTSTLQAQEGICVAIRMRPLNERELSGGQHELFRCLPNNSVGQLKDGQPLEGQVYYYDKVFDENTSTHIGTDGGNNIIKVSEDSMAYAVSIKSTKWSQICNDESWIYINSTK